MNRHWRNLPAYLQQANLSAQIPLMYRVDWAMHFVTVLLQIYVLKMVWTALYAGQGSVDQVTLSTLIAYLTLANLQFHLLWPFLAGYLQQRVRDGKVALDLARPVGLIGQMLSQQVGMTAGTVPFVLLAVPLGLLVGGIKPPESVGAAGLYLVSLSLAYAIVILLGLLLGLLSFWTLETSGFMVIYLFVNQFLAGTMVPLWFFPPVLRTIAEFLPFQSQTFVPVSIYLGSLQGTAMVRALLMQAGWVIGLALVAQVVWRQAMRRVVIQGG